jgi:chromatin structure-remodeling complex subunit RSC4
MSKREHGASDVEGSQTKRYKGTTGNSSDIDINLSDTMVPGGRASEQGGRERQDVVKEEGLHLWQIVRDAVNKEYVASCLIRTINSDSAPRQQR